MENFKHPSKMNSEHGSLGFIKAESGKSKKKILDFSANINPLKYNRLKNLLLKNIDSVFYYPGTKNKKSTKSIAGYLKVNPENIIVGNGTSELIYLIAHTFNPKSALIPVPTFSEYERAMNAINAKIHFLNLEKDNFKFLADKAKKFKNDILFLCNPNNPTGNLILNREEIYKIFQNFSIVVVDESFMEFTDDEERQTLIHEVEGKNFIVLRSFSKIFGLPGLRLGCAIGNKNIIEKLNAHLNPWNINSLASETISEILNEYNRQTIEKFKKRTCEFVDREKKFMSNEIMKIDDVKIYNSVTNFLLIKIPFNSSVFVQKLFEKNVFVRDCGNFRNLGNNYIRICIRSRKDNEKFINKFRDVLNELKNLE
ncbi:putative threonine-phosphate decarboxylase [groundwater metagenome]|uniref:Putative threonine-phosphate decarboxylase n=1 Tax=groundwater metagenome TaxID=717931 RepID=A0A098E7L0_9ZZZZ